jgi:hypothetical protein
MITPQIPRLTLRLTLAAVVSPPVFAGAAVGLGVAVPFWSVMLK